MDLARHRGRMEEGASAAEPSVMKDPAPDVVGGRYRSSPPAWDPGSRRVTFTLTPPRANWFFRASVALASASCPVWVCAVRETWRSFPSRDITAWRCPSSGGCSATVTV